MEFSTAELLTARANPVSGRNPAAANIMSTDSAARIMPIIPPSAAPRRPFTCFITGSFTTAPVSEATTLPAILANMKTRAKTADVSAGRIMLSSSAGAIFSLILRGSTDEASEDAVTPELVISSRRYAGRESIIVSPPDAVFFPITDER